MAHVRQSRPDSGLGFQIKVLETFLVVPSSLEPCPDSQGANERLTSGVTSPLQGAEVQNPLFSPLKRGCDPGSQTMC